MTDEQRAHDFIVTTPASEWPIIRGNFKPRVLAPMATDADRKRWSEERRLETMGTTI